MFSTLLNKFIFDLPQNSTMAPKIDLLYNFIYWVSVGLLVPTTIAMFYFAWKYRAGKNTEKVPYIHGNSIFEWSVSIFLSIIFIVIFVWGLVGFNEIHSPPSDAYEISVIAQQWMWQFQYANGKTTQNEIYVPKGVPVKLIMISKDVIHDFFVPNFRLKNDVLPTVYTTLWFQATHTGENDIFCAQYCGTGHSTMIGKVIVLEPQAFKAWLNGSDGGKKIDLATVGAKLFKQRNCIACHTVDGRAQKMGPSVKGLFGKTVAFEDGSQITADESYLRESIENPNAKIVKGYRPIMPTFKGLVDSEDINALIAYIKSLKE